MTDLSASDSLKNKTTEGPKARQHEERLSPSLPPAAPGSRRSPGDCFVLEKITMYLRLVLKVCEGCGILWFRSQDCLDVYCSACAVRMRELPRPSALRRRGWRRRPSSQAHAAGGGAA